MALILGMGLVVLLPAAVILAHWGHKRSVEQELQNAADALALASATKLREAGLGHSNPKAYDIEDIKQTVLDGNITTRGLDHPTVDVSVAAHPEHHAELVRVVLKMRYRSIFALLVRQNWVSEYTIEKRAYAKVSSWAMGGREWPIVVFVLHGAKSMKFSAKGSTMVLWDLAKQAVQTAIKDGLPVRLGLIVFRDKRDFVGMGYNRKNRPWWTWTHFIWGVYASGTSKNVLPAEGGAADQVTPPPTTQAAIGPDQLLITPPADEHAAALRLLAGVTKAEGYTNLGLALHEAKRLLAAYPGADRRVVLFTNDRIDYFISKDDKVVCTQGWSKYLYFKCPIYTKAPNGQPLDGISIDQQKIMEVAQQIRTLPDAGVGFHVVQLATKDWKESAKDRFKLGALFDLLKRLWDFGTRNLTQLSKALNEIGLPAQKDFFKRLAGGAGNAEGADENYWTMLEEPGQPGLLTGAVSRSICRFDPLHGKPESNDSGPRVHARFAFVRAADDSETRLQLVANGLKSDTLEGYEAIEGKRLEVALTPAACRKLGRDRTSKLVIRWGAPRLVAAEQAQAAF